MNDEVEGGSVFWKVRRGLRTLHEVLVTCSIIVTMVIWMVGVSLPVEWRWCGSAHIWSRLG